MSRQQLSNLNCRARKCSLGKSNNWLWGPALSPPWAEPKFMGTRASGKGINLTLPCSASGSTPGSQRHSFGSRTRTGPPASAGIGWNPAKPSLLTTAAHLTGSRSARSLWPLDCLRREKKGTFTRTSRRATEPGKGWSLHPMERQMTRGLLQLHL